MILQVGQTTQPRIPDKSYFPATFVCREYPYDTSKLNQSGLHAVGDLLLTRTRYSNIQDFPDINKTWNDVTWGIGDTINVVTDVSLLNQINIDVKVSEVNTLTKGKCIKIWVDEEFKHLGGQLGIVVGLQMPDAAQDTVRVFFSSETSVNLITGVQAGVNTFKAEPHTSVTFNIRCTCL